MNYNKITNAISKLMLLCGAVLLVLSIYSLITWKYPENAVALAIIKAVSLSDVPWRSLLFCSAVMELIAGMFGLNLKKGTGMAGLSLILGAIMTFFKACDIIELLLTGRAASLAFAGAVIFGIVYGLFTYCVVKQWDAY